MARIWKKMGFDMIFQQLYTEGKIDPLLCVKNKQNQYNNFKALSNIFFQVHKNKLCFCSVINFYCVYMMYGFVVNRYAFKIIVLILFIFDAYANG